MGLDMYLYKKSYVQNWEHTPTENKHTISIKKGGKVRKDIKPERICYITEQIAYWRKFNALHGWFVNECASGVDECQDMSPGKLLAVYVCVPCSCHAMCGHAVVVNQAPVQAYCGRFSFCQWFACLHHAFRFREGLV